MSAETIYVVGVWDLLHTGHISLLKKAKLLGESLVVGVHSDEYVFQYKKKRPIIPYEQRIQMLSSLGCVDRVIEGPPSNSLTLDWYKLNNIDVHVTTEEYRHVLTSYVPARKLGIIKFVDSFNFIHSSDIIEHINGQSLNVCIVGGGSAAHVMVGVLGCRNNISVSVFTRNPLNWSKKVTISDKSDNILAVGTVANASDDPSIVQTADVILIFLPAFARRGVIDSIFPHIRPGTLVGCIPGTGGFQWMAKDIVKKGMTIFCSQRLPFVCRILNYGSSVKLFGRKSMMSIAVEPKKEGRRVSSLLYRMFSIQNVLLENMLEVTLTPSNPILHPCRMFGLLEGQEDALFDNPPKFYEEWDQKSVSILKECDAEVQTLCNFYKCKNVLPLIKSYPYLYPGIDENLPLIEMLKTNPAYQGIEVPTNKNGQKFSCNYNSRYFTEDVPYGLHILCLLAEKSNIQCESLNKVYSWCCSVMESHGVLVETPFCLEDINL